MIVGKRAEQHAKKMKAKRQTTVTQADLNEIADALGFDMLTDTASDAAWVRAAMRHNGHEVAMWQANMGAYNMLYARIDKYTYGYAYVDELSDMLNAEIIATFGAVKKFLMMEQAKGTED